MLGVVNMFFILPTCTARENKVALRQENLPCSCLFFFLRNHYFLQKSFICLIILF